jgi:hypothetical protein
MNSRSLGMLRWFGFLDLIYIGWCAYVAISIGEIPFYSALMDDVATARSFGSNFSVPLTVLANALNFSIIFSGFLMVFGRRSGVYLSLAQSPFRLLLVIPFSFFFVMFAKNGLPSSAYIPLITLVYLLEFVKICLLVIWLKTSRIAG